MLCELTAPPSLTAPCRYGPGQCFGKHVDESVELGDGQSTAYTLLIYLSGSGAMSEQPSSAAVGSSNGKAGSQARGRTRQASKQGPQQQQQQQQQAGDPSKLPLVGGETVFYGPRGREVARVAPKAGLALLHRHGDECLEHEGAAVQAGLKYVLRSDVVFAG